MWFGFEKVNYELIFRYIKAIKRLVAAILYNSKL